MQAGFPQNNRIRKLQAGLLLSRPDRRGCRPVSREITGSKGLSLRVDVRHTNENDRFFATIGVFSRQSRTIVFRVDRRIFAVGPTGGRLLTSQVAQWFTNTCLLDFAASSPAFDYWTFLHLKVRNWTVVFNCSRFLGLYSSVRLIRMQTSQ